MWVFVTRFPHKAKCKHRISICLPVSALAEMKSNVPLCVFSCFSFSPQEINDVVAIWTFTELLIREN